MKKEIHNQEVEIHKIKKEAFQKGHAVGLRVGRKIGYHEGYDNGEQRGLDKGYRFAIEEDEGDLPCLCPDCLSKVE